MMRKNGLIFLLIDAILLSCCSCGPAAPKEIWDVQQYEEHEDIISIRKLKVDQIRADGVPVTTYKIMYRSDDCEVASYLAVPDGCIETETPYPCIIYNRGGNRDYGSITPQDAAVWAEVTNMVVFASQYRGADRGTGEDEFGGADLNDVIKLIDLCEDFSFVDMEQLYSIGVSRGGMMTYMACRQDSRIKKAVVISGVADLFLNYEERTDLRSMLEHLIGETPESNPDEYEKRSAVCWADEIQCPVLIIHSKGDTRVSFTHAEKMVEALEEAGKEYKFVSHDDIVHGLHIFEDVPVIMDWFS
ncbi:MAG: S9 family peptidase [Oscillospiraceae bacterium]|nr:S9 family peptidase [Oscillospiraceae bacterium]